jgi:hypothetical protein
LSRRRVAGTIFVIAVLGAGLYFLFRGAPVSRTLSYDLGPDHAQVVRFEARITLEGALVRQVVWHFAAGEAPRRVSHSVTLPAEEMTLTLTVEAADGEVRVETRAFDGAEPGDIVIHLSP